MTRVMSEEEKELRDAFAHRLYKKIHDAITNPDVRLVALIVDKIDPDKEGGGIVDLTHNCANSDAEIFETIKNISDQVLENIKSESTYTVQ